MNEELGDCDLSKRITAHLKNRILFKKELGEGKSAQEILGVSTETTARFYEAAYRLFEGKRYSEAADAFLFLVTLNPQNHDYWLGLGMSTQMKGNYEEAIDAYEMSAVCEMDNPVSYFYLAKCLFAIHDRESALQAIDLALEYAEERDEYQELRQQALAARALLIKA